MNKRADYIHATDTLYSIPVRGTLKGVFAEATHYEVLTQASETIEVNGEKTVALYLRVRNLTTKKDFCLYFIGDADEIPEYEDMGSGPASTFYVKDGVPRKSTRNV